MSDKARRAWVVPVRFNDGEQPTSTKLNALSNQARNSLHILERIVGDPWNMSGDPVLGANTTYALHIPNISRALGNLALLNPRLPDLPDLDAYTDSIGLRYQEQNEGYLLYPPDELNESEYGVGYVFTLGGIVQSSSTLIQGQFIQSGAGLTRGLLVGGDWSIDNTGKLVSFNPIPNTLTVTYKPGIISDTGYGINTQTSWNVIPDPSAWGGAYAGIKISYANDVNENAGYWLYLPPRTRLGLARTIAKSPNSLSNNEDSTPEAGDLLYFQDDTVDASSQAHYRYNFPEVLQGLSANDVIPAGFLYLWDETTGTIVEGVTFRSPDGAATEYVVQCTGADLATLFSGSITDQADEDPASYVSRFKIIVVGTSLAEFANALHQKFHNHTHNNQDGDNPVDHGNLINVVTPPYNASINPRYPNDATARRFLLSRWTGDDHSQYLHRRGTQDLTDGDPSSSSADRRDIYDGAFLGHLHLASTNGANYFNNGAADSHRLLFGAKGSGPNLFFDLASGGLTLANTRFILREHDGSGSSQIVFEKDTESTTLGRSALIVEKAGNASNFLFVGAPAASGSPSLSNARLYAERIVLANEGTDLFADPELPSLTDFVSLSMSGDKGVLQTSEGNQVIEADAGAADIELLGTRIFFGDSTTGDSTADAYIEYDTDSRATGRDLDWASDAAGTYLSDIFVRAPYQNPAGVDQTSSVRGVRLFVGELALRSVGGSYSILRQGMLDDLTNEGYTASGASGAQLHKHKIDADGNNVNKIGRLSGTMNLTGVVDGVYRLRIHFLDPPPDSDDTGGEGIQIVKVATGADAVVEVDYTAGGLTIQPVPSASHAVTWPANPTTSPARSNIYDTASYRGTFASDPTCTISDNSNIILPAGYVYIYSVETSYFDIIVVATAAAGFLINFSAIGFVDDNDG